MCFVYVFWVISSHTLIYWHFRAEEHLPNTLRQALIYKVILKGIYYLLCYHLVTFRVSDFFQQNEEADL